MAMAALRREGRRMTAPLISTHSINPLRSSRVPDPSLIKDIKQSLSIPVMAKSRVGHFVEAQILESIGVDYIDDSEALAISDVDRYQRVEKPKADSPIDENEIRITSQGRMRNYITYAMTMLQEKGSDEIVFKEWASHQQNCNNCGRRIVGLHQITAIQSTRRGIQKGRLDVLYPLRRYNHPKPLDNRSIMWNNGEIQVVSFVTDPAMCHVVEGIIKPAGAGESSLCFGYRFLD